MNTETETNFSEALMAILRLMKTLPRNEREELLHHVKCSLADVNRMYGQVLFDDEDDLDDWGDKDAATTARITVLSTVLGVDPR